MRRIIDESMMRKYRKANPGQSTRRSSGTSETAGPVLSPASGSAKRNLATTQILTIAISLFALTLSGASFYFQFLYVSEDFKATIINTQVRENKWVATLILINNGTRSAAVQDISLTTNPAPSGKGVSVSGFVSVSASPGLPLTVKPKDTLIVNLSADFNPSKLYEFGVKPSPSTGPFRVVRPDDERELTINVQFMSLTSQGVAINAEAALMTVKIGPNEERGECGKTSTTIDLLPKNPPGTGTLPQPCF